MWIMYIYIHNISVRPGYVSIRTCVHSYTNGYATNPFVFTNEYKACFLHICDVFFTYTYIIYPFVLDMYPSVYISIRVYMSIRICIHSCIYPFVYEWICNASVRMCVAVRCSVLQCIAFRVRMDMQRICSYVCCSVLQCVEVYCISHTNGYATHLFVCVLQCVAVCCSVLHFVYEWICNASVRMCVAVCCSVLHFVYEWICSASVRMCVAVCCSVLQCIAFRVRMDMQRICSYIRMGIRHVSFTYLTYIHYIRIHKRNITHSYTWHASFTYMWHMLYTHTQRSMSWPASSTPLNQQTQLCILHTCDIHRSAVCCSVLQCVAVCCSVLQLQQIQLCILHTCDIYYIHILHTCDTCYIQTLTDRCYICAFTYVTYIVLQYVRHICEDMWHILYTHTNWQMWHMWHILYTDTNWQMLHTYTMWVCVYNTCDIYYIHTLTDRC